MAKNRQKTDKEAEIKETGQKPKTGLKSGVKWSIVAIVLLCLAVVSVLSFLGHAGSIGTWIQSGSILALGYARFILPIILLAMVALLLNSKRRPSAILGVILFFLSLLGLFYVLGFDTGYVGLYTSAQLLTYGGTYVSIVVFLALLLISFLVIFNIPLIEFIRQRLDSRARGKETKEQVSPKVEDRVEPREPVRDNSLPVRKPTSLLSRLRPVAKVATKTLPEELGSPESEPLPLDLLDQRMSGSVSSGNLENNKKVIENTLENFGINVQMKDVQVGPTVTQYTFRPAVGVKLNKITSLQNDLSLALAAHPLRIEAPIPGKSLVGVEVPNQKSSIVRLGPLIAEKGFAKQTEPLSFVLGKDVAGQTVYADLSMMPHMLVAGATGAGKSVSLNVLIVSLLYRLSPDELQFMMIDPKRVELVAYDGIPHLISPVIVDHKQAIQSLNWAVKEMEDRLKKLQQAGSRDISSYNKNNPSQKMPYLVIVVDELSDLMSVSAREVEAMIVRLSQMARAVGIHLVISTQRPSVNVITGLIKANISSRIAFQVVTQVDSRTILDMAGAEKLLGRGDMLFLPRDLSKPRRIQGAYVSEREARRVVKELKQNAKESDSSFTPKSQPSSEEKSFQTVATKQSSLSESARDAGNTSGKEEELYEQAKGLVIEAGRASASLLQRHLRVGYARAARLLDLLEADGVVGPHQGSKPREVLVEKESS